MVLCPLIRDEPPPEETLLLLRKTVRLADGVAEVGQLLLSVFLALGAFGRHDDGDDDAFEIVGDAYLLKICPSHTCSTPKHILKLKRNV